MPVHYVEYFRLLQSKVSLRFDILNCYGEETNDNNII